MCNLAPVYANCEKPDKHAVDPSAVKYDNMPWRWIDCKRNRKIDQELQACNREMRITPLLEDDYTDPCPVCHGGYMKKITRTFRRLSM